MTDKEIIKDLEYRVKYGAGNKNDLDLINRQQAEIERLKSGCKKLVEKQKLYKDNMQATSEFQIEQAKDEAIKEVLNRFDIEYCRVFSVPEISFMKEFKRVFLKEMVGEKK